MTEGDETARIALRLEGTGEAARMINQDQRMVVE